MTAERQHDPVGEMYKAYTRKGDPFLVAAFLHGIADARSYQWEEHMRRIHGEIRVLLRQARVYNLIMRVSRDHRYFSRSRDIPYVHYGLQKQFDTLRETRAYFLGALYAWHNGHPPAGSLLTVAHLSTKDQALNLFHTPIGEW